jgi:hypothetical protein
MIDRHDRRTQPQHQLQQLAVRRARVPHGALRRVGLLTMLCVAACAVSGCVHRGVVMHGDWSIGVDHTSWGECGSCTSCGSVGSCRQGCRQGQRRRHLASKPSVREYESVPTVPRFHPVPTNRVLTDPSMSSPTPAEPLPGPPHDNDMGSGGSMKAPTDTSPPLPHDLGNGRYRAGRGQQQMARYRHPSQTPSRWAFRNAPPYYPRRR